jgi:hypothetical protein
VYATARRDQLPRLEQAKIRVQVILVEPGLVAAAARQLEAKDWQALNRFFRVAETAGAGSCTLQTFNLHCDVDAAISGNLAPHNRGAGANLLPNSGSFGAIGGVAGSPTPPDASTDSALNTPRSASSSARGPLMMQGMAALMFGAGAVVGAAAAVVLTRFAKNSGGR